MKKKGFTLVELLVVIAIIALLMGILMPALAQVKAIANRLVCGTNLSSIGKSMLIYAGDWDEQYPVSGQAGADWDTNGDIGNAWQANDAPGQNEDMTISSCFFLLVKWADSPTKLFVCKADIGTEEFEIDSQTNNLDELSDAWDFGTQPGKYCSYAYQLPFGDSKRVTGQSISTSPIAADRNPWIDDNAQVYLFDDDIADADYDTGKYRDTDKKEVAAAHQREGQNVLYNDIHVSFEKTPNCGVNLDNIYKYWNASTDGSNDAFIQVESNVPQDSGDASDGIGVGLAADGKDAYLVNESQSSGLQGR